MNKAERFKIFLAELAVVSPASSREQALDLVKQAMNRVEDEHSGLPWDNFAQRMHVYGFDPLYNWQDLDKDPCHWVDSVAKSHRIALFHSGRIQISSMRYKPESLIFDKAGN